MTLPDFIGIGAQKAGTSWLYQMLAQNPSIWLPPLKEVHFFDQLNPTQKQKKVRIRQIKNASKRLKNPERKKGSAGDNAAKRAFLKSLTGDKVLSDEWYQSIFAHPDAVGKVSGEITPSYLDNATDGLPKINEMLPSTKFVLIVREPLSRSLSHMRMTVSRAGGGGGGGGRMGPIPETREDWEFYVTRLKGNPCGTYQEAIPLWRSYFGPDRLLILPVCCATSRTSSAPSGSSTMMRWRSRCTRPKRSTYPNGCAMNWRRWSSHRGPISSRLSARISMKRRARVRT